VNADIACILLATAFAADKHRNQRRKDEEASPYINHPVALANLLAQAGVGDTTVLAAALLHDTIEDTDATVEELMGAFGEKITTVVLEVTDDKSLPKAERKRLQIQHATHLSTAAKLVKLALTITSRELGIAGTACRTSPELPAVLNTTSRSRCARTWPYHRARDWRVSTPCGHPALHLVWVGKARTRHSGMAASFA
jgi:hypothetical protein